MTDLDTEAKIESLSHRALAGKLPRAEWTHAAHFALVLWVLRHRVELGTPAAFREIILRLNKFHGTPNTDSEGYHHTITIASLRAARHVLESRASDEPLERVLAALVNSEYGRADWILVYFSRELLFSVGARRSWIEPDMAKMPF